MQSAITFLLIVAVFAVFYANTCVSGGILGDVGNGLENIVKDVLGTANTTIGVVGKVVGNGVGGVTDLLVGESATDQSGNGDGSA